MEAARTKFTPRQLHRASLLAAALVCCAGVVLASLNHRRSAPDSRELAMSEDLRVNASILPEPIIARFTGPKTVMMEVTAYCACPKCCGPKARGLTASGKHVSYNAGRFVAADTALLPFGSRVSVPGYHGGEAVEVIDRGSAIRGNKLDVFFPQHEAARQWGRQVVAVQVLE